MAFVVIFTALLGGLLALFGWRRSSTNTRDKVRQAFKDISTNFDAKLMTFIRAIFHHVIMPLVNFVTAVYKEVKHNLSTPAEVPPRPAGAVTVQVEGAAEKSESPMPGTEPIEGAPAEPVAPPTAKSFAEFCAAIIASFISSALALAYEGSKLIQYIISSRKRPATLLRIDMYDEPDTNTTTVQLDAPGVGKDGMDISLYEGCLTMACDALSDTALPLGRFYHRRERPQGRLSRTIRVPAGTKTEDLHANMTDGVLTITFPMSSAHKPEKIAIN